MAFLMRKILLDTSGLIAAGVKTERHHLQASNKLTQLRTEGVRLVVHDGVRVELLDTMSHTRARRDGLRIARTLENARDNGEVEFHPLLPELTDRAIELFAGRSDKEWG